MKKKPSNGRAEAIPLETRKLAELVEFPRQSAVYFDAPEREEQAFLESIRTFGIQQPVEILGRNKVGLDPNVMLDGHRRVRAGKENGGTETPVRVRSDLCNADWETIVKVFLSINGERRQMATLGRVRWHTAGYLQDKELADLSQQKRLELKNFLAGTMRMSTKNVERYLRLLTCPVEVQQVVEHNLVTLVLAVKVADLSEEEQRKIAARMRRGEDPKVVIQRFVKAATSPTQRGTSVSRGIRFLTLANEALDGFDLADYSGSLNDEKLAVVNAAGKICLGLVAASERWQLHLAKSFKKCKR